MNTSFAQMFRREDGSTTAKYKTEFVKDVYDYFLEDDECRKILNLFTGTAIIDQMKAGIGLDKGLNEFVEKIIYETIDDNAFEFTCARG